MKIKDLKINFRYLCGNIACLSVDSITGESIHNDINNEEAIIIFNSLIGEKENCQTVKTLLKENQELKKQLQIKHDGFMASTDELCEYAVENDKLEKQLEDVLNENRKLRKKLENCMTFEEYEYTLHKKVQLKTQQKDFIKYLEDKKISPIKCVLNSIDDKNHDYNMFKNKLDNYEEILQKYKEIIGE